MHKPLQLILLLISVFVISANAAAEEPLEPAQGWPRLYESSGNKVVVHQPQLDEWQEHTVLSGKAAVSVSLSGDAQEYYGALYLQAKTETDFESRTVLLKDFKVTEQTFPGLDEALDEKCQQAVVAALPKNRTMTISLDRILAGLEETAEQEKAVAVNLEPPPIYYSDEPAVLVIFLGEPKFEAVPGVAGLLYAVNTNWDILLDVSQSRYYLLNGDSWLVSSDVVKGHWEATPSLPSSFGRLPDDDDWKVVKQKIPGVRAATIPKVVVATQPAELIITDGVPSYSPIAGTRLMYIANTDSDIFLHSVSGQLYFLSAGRWFRSETLAGPWTAASADLPAEFGDIPEDHDKAHVLSAVPGTPDAEAAVLLASVPHKATVDRNTTTVDVVYEGKPEFVEIEDTSTTLYYAVNTPNSVFLVEKKYYTVHNGVWFESASAAGPWIVCDLVPQAIYSIPASHPKHNVTYVYVYDSTPDTVVVGYTSGYSGSYVAATGVLMFGLGYALAHDHYDNYHHYHYHPHYYAYGGGVRYDYYHGGYYHSARYYGPHGGAGGVAAYNPATGRYYRGGYASGPYGSAFAREAYNPYTGGYGAQARARTPYGSWGRSVVSDGDNWARAGHRSQYGKTVAGLGTSRGGKVVGGYNKWTGQGAVVGKDKHGDMYVGHDGNVYKRDNEGWQQTRNKGWKNVDAQTVNRTAQTRTRDRQVATTGSERKRRDVAPSTGRKFDSGTGKQTGSVATQRRSSTATQRRSSTTTQRRSSGTRSTSLTREHQKRQVGNSRANSFRQRSSRSGGRSSFGGGRSSSGGGRSGLRR